ncbi:MerR family transcriptional regulator [Streptosporangium fragile]|uniref:MerR family transcriptional regulator n=1 Tax=Streptosporangium fragile TaxID=46186 RepID=A0ABN3W408_9ACTN
MSIGELAALAGVTTWTVRRYHQVGLLPEPPRSAAGHRRYGMADVVRMIRIRRMVASGMGLPDVCRVLAPRLDLHTALADLDADLAAAEEAIRRQRAMLAELRNTGDDPTLTPELVHVVAELEQVFPAHPLLEREREMIALLEAAAPVTAAALTRAYRASLYDEGLRRRVWDLGLRFEALREAPAGHPEVAALATDLRDALAPYTSPARRASPAAPSGRTAVPGLGELSPAQREVIGLVER